VGRANALVVGDLAGIRKCRWAALTGTASVNDGLVLVVDSSEEELLQALSEARRKR
jgi:hypothetical protein